MSLSCSFAEIKRQRKKLLKEIKVKCLLSSKPTRDTCLFTSIRSKTKICQLKITPCNMEESRQIFATTTWMSKLRSSCDTLRWKSYRKSDFDGKSHVAEAPKWRLLSLSSSSLTRKNFRLPLSAPLTFNWFFKSKRKRVQEFTNRISIFLSPFANMKIKTKRFITVEWLLIIRSETEGSFLRGRKSVR